MKQVFCTSGSGPPFPLPGGQLHLLASLKLCCPESPLRGGCLTAYHKGCQWPHLHVSHATFQSHHPPTQPYSALKTLPAPKVSVIRCALSGPVFLSATDFHGPEAVITQPCASAFSPSQAQLCDFNIWCTAPTPRFQVHSPTASGSKHLSSSPNGSFLSRGILAFTRTAPRAQFKRADAKPLRCRLPRPAPPLHSLLTPSQELRRPGYSSPSDSPLSPLTSPVLAQSSCRHLPPPHTLPARNASSCACLAPERDKPSALSHATVLQEAEVSKSYHGRGPLCYTVT